MLDYFKNIVISGIPEIERIDEWNELSERLDIAYEYNDFFMPACINDDDEYKRRVRIYRSLGRKTESQVEKKNSRQNLQSSSRKSASWKRAWRMRR